MPLDCREVSFGYADAAPVLRSVSLSVAPGELVGLAGRSGCGKTTLLRLLAAREAPDAGTLSLDGRASDGSAEAKRAFAGRVALVQQLPERQLFASTVYEDVAFGPKNQGLPEAEVASRVEEALQAVGFGLSRAREASPFALSGGEKRRVCIASALALHPAYLLCDEPTAGLDPRQRDAVMDVLARCAEEGCGVVVVSHDLELLSSRASRLMLLDGGRVAYDGPAEPALADGELLASLGLAQPFAARLASRLRSRGAAVDESAVTPETLVASIARLAGKGERP